MFTRCQAYLGYVGHNCQQLLQNAVSNIQLIYFNAASIRRSAWHSTSCISRKVSRIIMGLKHLQMYCYSILSTNIFNLCIWPVITARITYGLMWNFHKSLSTNLYETNNTESSSEIYFDFTYVSKNKQMAEIKKKLTLMHFMTN